MLSSIYLFSQDLTPTNETFKYKVIAENNVVEKDDSLYALIVDFDKTDNQTAQKSIQNNPQLKEIKLYSPNQEFVNFLSSEKNENLSYLIIEKFELESLFVPSFSKLKYFEINSDSIVLLDITQSDFNQLTTLNIDGSRLLNCNTEPIYPILDILNLHAPLLQFFPFTNTPRLTALSWKCSFKVFPENLCSYNDLVYIAIWNYYPALLKKCLKKKIKMGIDSNLIIYDKIDGKKLKEVLSKN